MHHYLKSTRLRGYLPDCIFEVLTNAPEFESAEHEKAWVLRTAVNACKDFLDLRYEDSSISLIEQPFSVETAEECDGRGSQDFSSGIPCASAL